MRRRVGVGTAFELVASIRIVQPAKRVSQRRKRVAVGTGFDAKATVGPEAADARARVWIVWAVVALSSIFLIGAAILGLFKGDFGALRDVWGVVAAIYGGLAGYFFSKGGRG